MPLRAATSADLLPAAKCLASALKDNELFGEYMHPHRKEYPNDMQLFFLRLLREMYYCSADDHILLATAGTTARIVGVAIWTRKRGSKWMGDRTRLDPFDRIVTRAKNAVSSFFYPDRAADPTRLDVLERMEPFTAHLWKGTRAESWYLDLLGVEPDEQGQGYGREMVQWGFERAKEEGIGCSVTAADGKERFYERCGFDVKVGMASESGGDANPLKDVPGGMIMFWDGERAVEEVEDKKGVDERKGAGIAPGDYLEMLKALGFPESQQAPSSAK